MKPIHRLRDDQTEIQRQMQPAAGKDQVRLRPQPGFSGVAQGVMQGGAESKGPVEGGRILVAARDRQSLE
jgi:hypothetical protein